MKQTLLFSKSGGCGCDCNPITGGLIRCARHENLYQQTLQDLTELETKRKQNGHYPPELQDVYRQRMRAFFVLRGVYGLESIQGVTA
jgi:hypothetical protein